MSDYGVFLNAPYNEYSITESGEAYSHKRNKVTKLNPTLMKNGYYAIGPTAKGLKAYQPKFYIHHLVAEYFIGPRPEGNYVRHLDGDKLNNHVSNLAYGTPQDNINDTMRHGRVPKGAEHYQTKFADSDVLVIVERMKAGEQIKKIAADYNVAPSVITNIKNGKTWTHVTGGKVETPHKWQIISSDEREIIKQRLASGESSKDLAVEYGVCKDLINKIRRCY